MAEEFTYWLPPSAVKQSGKTMIAGPIFPSCTRRAARSGTFSLKFFHADVREARAGEAHHVHEHREAPPAAARGALVVLRRQPHGELAHVRVAERVALQDLRDVLQHTTVPGFHSGA